MSNHLQKHHKLVHYLWKCFWSPTFLFKVMIRTNIIHCSDHFHDIAIHPCHCKYFASLENISTKQIPAHINIFSLRIASDFGKPRELERKSNDCINFPLSYQIDYSKRRKKTVHVQLVYNTLVTSKLCSSKFIYKYATTADAWGKSFCMQHRLSMNLYWREETRKPCSQSHTASKIYVQIQ